MSRQMENSLFIFSSRSEFYQRLLNGISDYHHLGNRIIKEIKVAQAFRQANRVREYGNLLINLPLRELQLIGQYYLAWCDGRESKYRTHALEKLVEQTATYKTKALLSLAAFEGYQGRIESSFYHYTEALKTRPSASEYIEVSKSIAALKSMEGFHESALAGLESVLPLVRYSEPQVYYDFLNSYAVELGEAGRKEEARNVSEMVLASPFAAAYPEWQDTGRGLGLIGCRPLRSFVSFDPDRVEKPALPIQAAETVRAPEPAKVLPFSRLKEAPPPEKPEKVTPREIGEMTFAEKRELLFTALRSGAIAEGEYNKMIVMFGLLDAGPAANVIDLEDETTLDDLMVVWANQIEPEQLVGVLSALRDCDDGQRRNAIIDRMIRKAFQCSMESKLTEEEWRLKVECRLPRG